MVPSSNGHRRRRLLSSTTKAIEFPLYCGIQRPCRDDGGGEIAPGFAMLERAKRDSHIDPPTSVCTIMRRTCPDRGENHGPGKDKEMRA
jgi:hypothetical protein